MGNYFVENKETGKIELYFDKSTYQALSDDEKAKIRSNFLFSRYSSAWVSRRKFPNLYLPRQIATDLGLTDEGTTGEKLTFEEQQERKNERAERRADRYEAKAENAAKKGEQLQKPINDMHGDIAFFTQPIIAGHAGSQSFGRRREKMWKSYENGMEEFRKSAYYRDRAETARQSTETPTKGFCQRRIEDAEKSIRAQKRNIASYEEAKIKFPQNVEKYDKWIEHAEEIIEDSVSKIAYYDSLIEAQGGLFDKTTLKAGDLVKVEHWGVVRYVKGGTKNFTYELLQPHMTYADGSPMKGQAAFAEIIKKVEKPAEKCDN